MKTIQLYNLKKISSGKFNIILRKYFLLILITLEVIQNLFKLIIDLRYAEILPGSLLVYNNLF